MSTVTLRDGNQVSEEIFKQVSESITDVLVDNCIALSELVEKCNDAGYEFIKNPLGDSAAILKKFGLMDDRERVNPDIKKIVLNSIEGSWKSLKFVDPLQSKEVSKII